MKKILPYKIFQIGFNKCGTVSLWKIFNDFLQEPINAVHWDKGLLAKTMYENLNTGKNLLVGYEDYSYFGDMQYQLWIDNKPKDMILPYLSMFKILDQQYPNSKFILNTRDINNWLRSRENWAPGGDNNFYMKLYGIDNIIDLKEIYKETWIRHHSDVTEYFSKRPDDLLIYNIETDNIKKLTNFFVDIKFNTNLTAFPHLNKSK